ncbi:MAG: hypothetical protein FJ271_15100 [Planctomycetes bacterium]|nr:hypothetical protein [Planctomycetota bacterium]
MLKNNSSALGQIRSRRGEGNGGLIAVVLIVGGLIWWWGSNTQEGKQAFKQTVAAVQPPVQVSLTPYLIFNGYYVNVTNTSSHISLTDVTVTYTDATGNSVMQRVGSLRPGETKTLDPSDARWTVERHETISVAANGLYVPKALDTNVLIHR